MDKSLEKVCQSLDELAKKLLTITTDDRTMTEIYGWNCPALTRHDLSNLVKNISNRLVENDVNIVDEILIKELQKIPLRINIFIASSFPQLLNSNLLSAITTLMALVEWITQTLKPIFGWKVLQDNKALPNQLAKRLRSIQIELDNLIPDKENLEGQIKLIKDATDAAESLPTDIDTLKEARKKIDIISTDSAILFGKIDTYHKDSDDYASKIQTKKQEADKLVEQCEEAYRITTTKGLAAAFDLRAKKLSQTMWIWVAGLLISLIAGGFIGASRFETLAKSLASNNPQWGVIWIDIVLSIVGLAAPIWFAWLATKQINQNFRLSEDYAFKASVAKAYEGYKKEAARIDEAFEARLFSSALSRLEEAPLRLVESDNHGSPWHELFSSTAFQKAMNSVPELKEKFIEIAKHGITSLKRKEKVEIAQEE